MPGTSDNDQGGTLALTSRGRCDGAMSCRTANHPHDLRLRPRRTWSYGGREGCAMAGPGFLQRRPPRRRGNDHVAAVSGVGCLPPVEQGTAPVRAVPGSVLQVYDGAVWQGSVAARVVRGSRRWRRQWPRDSPRQVTCHGFPNGVCTSVPIDPDGRMTIQLAELALCRCLFHLPSAKLTADDQTSRRSCRKSWGGSPVPVDASEGGVLGWLQS